MNRLNMIRERALKLKFKGKSPVGQAITIKFILTVEDIRKRGKNL
jgi:hypothetical protein